MKLKRRKETPAKKKPPKISQSDKRVTSLENFVSKKVLKRQEKRK